MFFGCHKFKSVLWIFNLLLKIEDWVNGKHTNGNLPRFYSHYRIRLPANQRARSLKVSLWKVVLNVYQPITVAVSYRVNYYYYYYYLHFYLVGILKEGFKCSDCHNGCCLVKNCLNGGTCQEICDVNSKRFQCKCRPGYTGTYCDIGES